jgi:hypothetical protein
LTVFTSTLTRPPVTPPSAVPNPVIERGIGPVVENWEI